MFRTSVGVAALALPLVALSDWYARGEVMPLRLAVVASILAVGLVCLELSRRGWWDTSGALLIGVIWLAVTFYCLKTGYGLHSSMILFYLPCMLYATIFFGTRIAVAVLGATLVVLAGMFWAEETGRIGGIHAFIATGDNRNFLLGVVAACVGTLAGGAVYQRRVALETTRLYTEAMANRDSVASLQAALSGHEATVARLASINAELSAGLRARTAEVAQLRREGDDVVRALTHDVQVPLHALREAAAMLEPASDDGQRLLRADVERLASIVEALRELGDAGRRELQPASVDLGALFREMAARTWSAATRERVRLDVEPGLEASGDPELLAALARRLLDNALRSCHGEPVPRVQVGRGSQDGRMVFYVRDSGFRAGPLSLDLGIARRIAERHGGELAVHSNSQQGNTVMFSLSPPPDAAGAAKS